MKKIVSVILSLVLLMSVFTACSKAEDSEAKEKDNISITVDSHYSSIDSSVIRAYEKLCNAVIAGEKEVKFNAALSEDVNQLFYTCFPLYTLVESVNTLEDLSGVSIAYKNSDEEHQKLISQFYDKIEEIKNVCEYDSMNTSRYIFNVYDYIIKNIKIDNSVVSTFDTIMQGRGCPAAICSMFEYLVLQGGGNASHVSSALDIVSYAEFMGKWYYFNPSMDISDNEKKTLKGFAMDSERAGGMIFYYTDEVKADKVSDQSYESLKNSSDYELDGDEVNVSCNNGKNFMLKFN